MIRSFLTTLFNRGISAPASALLDACKSGTVDEVSRQLNLESGSQPSAELLKAAIDGNNTPVLGYLIAKFKDEQPLPPWQADRIVIMEAAERLEHFKLFWEADPSVNMAYLGHTGNMPGWAVLRRDVPLLTFLLKTGANPDDAELFHRPAITRAISFGYSDIVSLLLDHGAHVKESNALAIALEADKLQVDIIKLLVEKGGMDLNIAQKSASDDGSGDNDGDDAAKTGPVLHLAIAKGQTEIVRALLQDLKADPTVKDGEGRTALQRAQEQGNREILDLLAQWTKG
ncbi:ankyrin repeat-containing domain protein [Plectosphaerella plurivora]|uniref:Ankyrin repeat-containing domain protein n=1 Tax=Plectosphaerella plurivora TaxID=936078 RepID=A0A9P8V5A4_9PEZI|nr:ankyrin repeat-containing domain protein [Plectosphaerella plurivora]